MPAPNDSRPVVTSAPVLWPVFVSVVVVVVVAVHRRGAPVGGRRRVDRDRVVLRHVDDFGLSAARAR